MEDLPLLCGIDTILSDAVLCVWGASGAPLLACHLFSSFGVFVVVGPVGGGDFAGSSGGYSVLFCVCMIVPGSTGAPTVVPSSAGSAVSMCSTAFALFVSLFAALRSCSSGVSLFLLLACSSASFLLRPTCSCLHPSPYQHHPAFR